MICPNCNNDVEWKDFFGKDVCYKCIYKEKLKNHKEACPICRSSLPSNRWRYCCDRCAEIAAVTQRREYQKKFRGICVNSQDWHSTNFNLNQPNHDKEEYLDSKIRCW